MTFGFGLGTLAAGGNFWTPALLNLTGWWRDFEAVPDSGSSTYVGKPSLGPSVNAILNNNPSGTNVAPGTGPNGHNLVTFPSGSLVSTAGTPFFFSGYNPDYYTYSLVGSGWALVAPGSSGLLEFSCIQTVTSVNWGTFQLGVKVLLNEGTAYTYLYNPTTNYGLYSNGEPQIIQGQSSGSLAVPTSPYYLLQFRYSAATSSAHMRINGSAWLALTYSGYGVPASGILGPGASHASMNAASLKAVRQTGTPQILDMGTAAYSITVDEFDLLLGYVNRYYQVGL
jgi:hypothetical protein